MKKLYLLWLILIVAAPLAARASYAGATGAEMAMSDAQENGGDAEVDLYSQGTEAVDDEEWTHAIDIFKRVAAMKGKRADAALYWLAYAQEKAGRGAEAVQTITALERTYPSSRWVGDAKALKIDIQQSAGDNVDPAKVADEDLKLIIIQNLVSSDPERAMPLLQKILDGAYSKRMKEQALFVLSQSASPRAATLIASIARGSSHPELQSEAIKHLGIAGKRHLALLGEVYESTQRAEVKKEILRAYMVAGARSQVLAAARGEKDQSLRAEAIRQLGVMGGTTELQTLYRAETSAAVKKTIIESLFTGGSSDALLEIARSEPDVTLRASAVRTLGLMGRDRTGATLITFYRSNADAEVRRAALDGLFVQGNAHALVDLARQESDPKWKREIVSKLSVMNSKEAIDYLTSLLE